MTNQLYYGDNLDVLREHIPDESVDLVYLDPPFNSNRNYNVLFREKSGESSPAQIEAFTDTWQWDQNAEVAYHELTTLGSGSVSKMIEAMRQFVGSNDMMAYLVMMAQRIVELHRVLKPTGSLYLHCDSTANHYLKVLLDTVLGVKNFRNEIIWKRYSSHNDSAQGTRHFGRIHDVILFYSKTDAPIWRQTFTPYDPAYINESYKHVEEATGRRYSTSPMTGPGGAAKGNPVFDWQGHIRAWRYSKETMQRLHDEGRIHYSKTGNARQIRYLDEAKGLPTQDIWSDINSLSGAHAERLGYPTQKPLALLERIIEASSNPGDVVLDPFCGCGTSVVAAQKLNRKWIGIDITHLAVSLIRTRLIDTFGDEITGEIEVIGDPKDPGAARALFEQDPYQFEWWALSLVNAMPANAKKKGADRGIDGEIRFHVDTSGKVQRCLVQVKGGGVNSSVIRDLKGTMEREKAVMGILITLQPPSRPMRTEALEAGFYTTPTGHDFPVIQILTIEELLSGTEARTPNTVATFARAQRHREKPVTERLVGLE
jgi:DNA modification methylase